MYREHRYGRKNSDEKDRSYTEYLGLEILFTPVKVRKHQNTLKYPFHEDSKKALARATRSLHTTINDGIAIMMLTAYHYELSLDASD